MNAHIASVGALVMLLGWAWTVVPGREDAPATEAPPAAELAGIAVLDVGRVFREHREFNERVNRIRGEVAEAQQTVSLRQVEIESTQRKLQGLQPGTPEHEQTQQLLVRLQTDLQRFSTELQQELMSKEMAVFAQTYDQIAAVVEQYARAHGLRLVLRSHETPMNPDNRASVLGTVNREVVYQQGLDITAAIIEQANVQ